MTAVYILLGVALYFILTIAVLMYAVSRKYKKAHPCEWIIFGPFLAGAWILGILLNWRYVVQDVKVWWKQKALTGGKQ